MTTAFGQKDVDQKGEQDTRALISSLRSWYACLDPYPELSLMLASESMLASSCSRATTKPSPCRGSQDAVTRNCIYNFAGSNGEQKTDCLLNTCSSCAQIYIRMSRYASLLLPHAVLAYKTSIKHNPTLFSLH